MTDDRGEDRVGTWSALVGGLAHELKNPLSTLNINLQLLREDWSEQSGPLAGRSIRKIDVMLQESKRLERMLADFLRLTSPSPLDRKPCDLNRLIEDVLSFMEKELSRKKIDVAIQVDHRIGLVEVDENLIRQVIINLVKNAMEAMAEKGGSLTVQTALDGREIRIELIDTGIGMDEATLAHAFGVYFSTKAYGTGLGLPMVRRIIERHGGSVDCESARGFGTRFILRLPVLAGGDS